jgi:hypothetical protein
VRWPARTARWARRGCLLAFVVFVALAGVSISQALVAPGTDSTSARLAEWGRDHGLGDVVTWLEKQQYERHPPAIGGKLADGIPSAAGFIPPARTPPKHPSSGIGPPAPAAMTPFASPALPGEGQWQTVVVAKGRPAVRIATLRPDAVHTSYLATVMWLDPTLVRGQLRPGTKDPGGTWQAATSITQGEQSTIAAAFNAGFRLTRDASHGGYYSEGRTAVPLADGAASLVLRTDGTATVGTWNHEVRMGADVASVRQNLVMLVDNGQVSPTCLTGGNAQWGSTVGQAAFMDRSAFGVTADGAEVYIGGQALSVCQLGKLLVDAGVVRGMELDINPAWVSGVYFHQRPHGAPPQGFRLFPGQQTPPEHYLSQSSRDWYAWFVRA